MGWKGKGAKFTCVLYALCALYVHTYLLYVHNMTSQRLSEAIVIIFMFFNEKTGSE